MSGATYLRGSLAASLGFLVLITACECLLDPTPGSNDDSNDVDSQLTTDPDVTPPTVSTASPGDGEHDVPLDALVSVTFDEALDPATVNNQTLLVISPRGAVDGAVSYDDATFTAEFTPTRTLILGASYTVTLTTDVADVAGNMLDEDVTWNFAAREGEWGVATRISESTTPSSVWGMPDGIVLVISDPCVTRFVPGEGWSEDEHMRLPMTGTKLVIDETYNALAVWKQSEPLGSAAHRLYSSCYTVADGWTDPITIEDNPHKTVETVPLRTDSAGNVILMWRQCNMPDDGTPYSVWVTRYEPGIGWETAQQLSNPLTFTSEPCLAICPNGEALAVWRAGSSFLIMTRRYSPQTGWGKVKAIHNSEGEQLGHLRLAQNASGQAIVGWWQNDRMWSTYYDPQTGWTESVPYEEEPTPWSFQSSLRLIIDEDGMATAVWENDALRATRYILGEGWTANTVLTSGALPHASLYLDHIGNVHVLWRSQDGPYVNIQSIRYCQYNLESGWSTSELVGITGTNIGYKLDPLGNGFLIWASAPPIPLELIKSYDDSEEPTVGIWVRRYLVGEGWTQTRRLDPPDDATQTSDATVFVDDSGRATFAWRQNRQETWVCRFE